MRIIGRTVRLVALAIVTLLGSLSAVSMFAYARYGRVFRKTVTAAASYMVFFYGLAYAIWRFCGDQRRFDLDGEGNG